MSRIHCAPQDSVRLFKDIRAKKALGMHWGCVIDLKKNNLICNLRPLVRTWVLTTEDVLDPPKRLAEECKKSNIDEDAFITCDIGETLLF
jgi:N-acyl-phosphatidylethanolamine-hydrolysing phospholipase D